MLQHATRNPEHLSMSRDSNCTKKFWLGWMDKAVQEWLLQERRPNGQCSSDGFGLTCTNTNHASFGGQLGQSRRGSSPLAHPQQIMRCCCKLELRVHAPEPAQLDLAPSVLLHPAEHLLYQDCYVSASGWRLRTVKLCTHFCGSLLHAPNSGLGCSASLKDSPDHRAQSIVPPNS